jgi:hypothetical protein
MASWQDGNRGGICQWDMLVAILIKSSGSQINCALNPSDGNVTIQALQRAAALVGRRVKVELF